MNHKQIVNPLLLFCQPGISRRLWFERLLYGERWRVEQSAWHFQRSGYRDHPQAEKIVTKRWRRMAWVGINTTVNEGLTEQELSVLWQSPGVWLLLYDLMHSDTRGINAGQRKAG